MKKILLILIFYSSLSFGQKTGYGYQSRSKNQNDNNNKEVNCDELVKSLEVNGRYLAVSYGGYESNTIEKIKWYNFNEYLFCVVYFKTSTYKGYVYGGWAYEYNQYYNLKKSFEESQSKGEFFWKYIESSKVKCK